MDAKLLEQVWLVILGATLGAILATACAAFWDVWKDRRAQIQRDRALMIELHHQLEDTALVGIRNLESMLSPEGPENQGFRTPLGILTEFEIAFWERIRADPPGDLQTEGRLRCARILGLRIREANSAIRARGDWRTMSSDGSDVTRSLVDRAQRLAIVRINAVLFTVKEYADALGMELNTEPPRSEEEISAALKPPEPEVIDRIRERVIKRFVD